jgi:hypothetical protein
MLRKQHGWVGIVLGRRQYPVGNSSMRIFGAACLFWILTAAAATAQDWALEMFHRQTTHNFGTVARGAKVEYAFVVENVFKEDAHIVSATSSCGCTRPSVTDNFIRTWQKSAVICSIDTKSFLGHREAAVTVRFDRPFPAEVILHVSVFIRGDVVVQPGEIDFGSVSQGARPSRQVTISYAGVPNWEITTIETSNRFLDIHAVESSRTAQQVTYDLTVSLKENAPAGYLRDQLILVTNDTNPFNSRVPVPLEGIIVPSISVRPSPLLMGVANSGHSVTKTLVVQGHLPFRILDVRCSDPRFKFGKPPLAQSLQLIPVTFAAGEATGAIERVIHIETDNSGKPTVDVAVQVRVVPGATAQLETPGPIASSPAAMPSASEPQAALPPDEPKTVAVPATSPAIVPAAPPAPAVPAAEIPSPPVLKSAPAAEKNNPARESPVNESEASGPDLAAPGQPVKKPGLQMPWSNILNTPDGPATRTGAKDPAAAEVPPSPSSSSATAPPAEVPITAMPSKATAVPADASALPATASPGLPAVSPASATATTPPQVLPTTVSGAVPLQRPAFGPDGKPLPRQTVKTDAAPPHHKATEKPAPAKPPLPWETPPPAQPLPQAAPPQK